MSMLADSRGECCDGVYIFTHACTDARYVVGFPKTGVFADSLITMVGLIKVAALQCLPALHFKPCTALNSKREKTTAAYLTHL